MKSLYKFFIALAFLGLAACGSDSDECSPCSTTSDCDEGLVCGADFNQPAYCVPPNQYTLCVL